jgi:hypothetical protein
MKLTDKEFFSAIKRLKSNKFGGLQLITNDMLKAGQNILAPSLLKLFNSTFFYVFYLLDFIRIIGQQVILALFSSLEIDQNQ